MNKLPLVSTATVASLVRLVLIAVFARFGWEVADEKLGEIAAWFATGLMIFGSLLWSWLSDRKVAKGEVKPLSLKPTNAAPYVMLLIACTVVLALAASGGCSPHMRSTLTADELSSTESPKNKALMTEEGWTFESNQQITGITVDTNGLDAATEGQYSTATIGDLGLVVNSPANIKAGKIVFRSKKPIYTTDESGNHILVRVVDPASGELVALVAEQAIDIDDYTNDNTSNLAEFTKRVQVEVTYAIELAKTNVEKYREYMATIRATAPELADVVEGIVKAFVPGVAVIP